MSICKSEVNFNFDKCPGEYSFSDRKKIMKSNRSAIPYDVWIEYVKDNYYDWWKSDYEDKWEISIIYYPLKNISSQIYKFYINKYTSMENIMFIFRQFLIKQHLTIILGFGEDIYSIIKNYIPSVSTIKNNYLYMHQHIPDYFEPSILSFKRKKLPNNLELCRIFSDCHYQLTDQINLRLREKKLNEMYQFDIKVRY